MDPVRRGRAQDWARRGGDDSSGETRKDCHCFPDRMCMSGRRARGDKPELLLMVQLWRSDWPNERGDRDGRAGHVLARGRVLDVVPDCCAPGLGETVMVTNDRQSGAFVMLARCHEQPRANGTMTNEPSESGAVTIRGHWGSSSHSSPLPRVRVARLLVRRYMRRRRPAVIAQRGEKPSDSPMRYDIWTSDSRGPSEDGGSTTNEVRRRRGSLPAGLSGLLRRLDAIEHQNFFGSLIWLSLRRSGYARAGENAGGARGTTPGSRIERRRTPGCC